MTFSKVIDRQGHAWRKLGFAESDADSGACGHIPKSPRFRSARNVAVLGSKEPRQVPTFLNGFLWEYGHRLRCRLKVAKAGLRNIPPSKKRPCMYCRLTVRCNCSVVFQLFMAIAKTVKRTPKLFPLTLLFASTRFCSYALFCSKFIILRFQQGIILYSSAISRIAAPSRQNLRIPIQTV